jgi:hypothetical protein
MKNNFKIGFLALSLCFVFSAQSQIKYGVKGGFSASNMSSVNELTDHMDVYPDFDTKFKPGFHLGAMMQMTFEENFFLQPELLFSNQGLKTNEMNGDNSKTFNVNYLKLPVYTGLKIKTGTNLDILLGVGPYFAYGLNGADEPFSFSGDGSKLKLKRFDMGIGLMGGVQCEKIQIALGYEFGIIDAVTKDNWDRIKQLGMLPSVYHQNVKISVGYLF